MNKTDRMEEEIKSTEIMEERKKDVKDTGMIISDEELSEVSGGKILPVKVLFQKQF